MSTLTAKSSLSFPVAACLAVAAVVAACSTGGVPGAPPATGLRAAEPTGPSAPPDALETPASSGPNVDPTQETLDTVDLKVYLALFVRHDESSPVLVPVHRAVGMTGDVEHAAMEALLEGPTPSERADDLGLGTMATIIPEETRLVRLDIAGGHATVDLSAEFVAGDIADTDVESWAFRLAQVTYTLTQFPTVETVAFRIQGRPIDAIEGHEGSPIPVATRAAYTDQLPGVFVDTPARGSRVDETFEVSGVAQVLTFPSRFEVALVDGASGAIVTQETIRAACDAACWLPPGGGEFHFNLSIPDGTDRSDLRLRVWELAPDEGGIVNFLEIPLR